MEYPTVDPIEDNYRRFIMIMRLSDFLKAKDYNVDYLTIAEDDFIDHCLIVGDFTSEYFSAYTIWLKACSNVAEVASDDYNYSESKKAFFIILNEYIDVQEMNSPSDVDETGSDDEESLEFDIEYLIQISMKTLSFNFLIP